ncbi:MAG: peptidoglycan recognition family protein [Rhizonema sp. PD37]|nr:peptidoglycan recognition family protein [Rhizonema sp. PD37]
MKVRLKKTWVPIVLLLFVCFIVWIYVTTGVLQNKPIVSQSHGFVWSQYPYPKIKLTKEQQSRVYSSAMVHGSLAKSQPKYKVVWVDPSNYGERYPKDIYGKPVKNKPIIVLHETDASTSSVINFFQTSHQDESVQASYHTLIQSDGTVVYLVPPEKRAFGAANSVFDSIKGAETIKTNPHLAPSVNNFAYHISLESPREGYMNNNPTHRGYTEAQYYSLAWLISQLHVPDERITTHKLVDRSGQKIDPRSFDVSKFLDFLHTSPWINTLNKIK